MNIDTPALVGAPRHDHPMRRVQAARERQRALNAARSEAERSRYEARLFSEARAIVAGTSDVTPHREHLRLLLAALDQHPASTGPAVCGG